MRSTHPHTRLRRLTAVVWALLFLVTGAAQGFGTHACAHHDPALAALVAHGAGSAHAAPIAHAAIGADHTGHDAGQPAHAGCTCIGACQAGGVLLLPASAPAATIALVSATPALARAAAHDEQLPGRTPHTLPFAQAPPALG